MQCVCLISFQQNLTIYTPSVQNSTRHMAEPMICYITFVYSIFAVDEVITLILMVTPCINDIRLF